MSLGSLNEKFASALEMAVNTLLSSVWTAWGDQIGGDVGTGV